MAVAEAREVGTEELVTFRVGERRPLPAYGVLHRPTAPGASLAGSTAVVLLGGWSGTRVGPHGILVAAARALAQEGFPSLRFDFRGRGDSGGDQRSAHIGTMVEDAVAAAEWLKQRGASRILLLGICAGAQVAMGAAPLIPGLVGMALWSPPPLHPDPAPVAGGDPGSATLRSDSSARRKRTALLKQYAAKLFDSRTWAKLIHGQLQPKVILRILSGRGGRAKEAGSVKKGGWAGPKPDERTFEERLKTLDVPALYIFGSQDPEREESTAYYLGLRSAFADRTRVHVVEGANHAFYSLVWKEEVIRETLAWVGQVCGGSST